MSVVELWNWEQESIGILVREKGDPASDLQRDGAAWAESIALL